VNLFKVAPAALAVAALALAGLGTSAVAQSPLQQSDTIVMAMPPASILDDFFTVESATNESSNNLQANDLMYEPLVLIGPKDTPVYSRSLAESIVPSKHDSVYTIHLNPKWHWSNGKPVTSADVVFTYDIMAAACTDTAPWSYAQCESGGIPNWIQSFVAQGPDTVVVTLDGPHNPEAFIQNGLTLILPVPKSVWDKYANWTKELNWIKTLSSEPTAAQYKVIDGPFFFQSTVSSEYYTFVPNKAYDGHKPTIKKFVYETFASGEAEFAALRKGTVNVGYLPNAMYGARAQLEGEYDLSSVYGLGFTYLQPNYNPKAADVGSLFSDVDVRIALQEGIDQETMLKIADGQGVTDYSPIPKLPANPFFDANAGHAVTFDPAAGKALLLKDGFKLKNGVMTKDGHSLEFTLIYTSGNQTYTDWVTLAEEDWAKEGIKVTVEPQPFDTVLADLSETPALGPKWSMLFWGGWGYWSYPSGDAVLGTGSVKWDDYDSATMNKYINATLAAGTPAQEKAAMDAYQAYAVDAVPVIYLPELPSFWEVSPSVHNVISTMSANGTYYPEFWTVSK
jgi:peptide/nickel transport system substrate-binding protein